MKAFEFEAIINKLSVSELDHLRQELYSKFQDAPTSYTGVPKITIIHSFTYWVKGHPDRVDTVLKAVDTILANKKAIQSDNVPGTHFIKWEDFMNIQSVKDNPVIIEAINFKGTQLRKYNPVTRDGYLSVDALYNMSRWANWKCSSLSSWERDMAQNIDKLMLSELMKLNQGRRADQAALFPVRLLNG